MTKRYEVLAVFVFAAVIAWLAVTKPWRPQSIILKPAPVVESEIKRYVMWNRSDFEKAPGQAMSAFGIQMLNAMGATNIQQMELINGATFEVSPEDERKVQAFGLTAPPEWEIQPEYTHHILGGAQPLDACFQCAGKLTPVACPIAGPNPPPAPTPGPGPAPTPVPTPPPPGPVEPNKSWGRQRVHAPEALAAVDTSRVKVCVIDTGIDLQHPNKGNVIASTGFAGAVQDRQGHGTHTAGTVAGSGGVGVSRASLLICKGLSDSGSGSSSALAQCLTWCGQQGSHIVSNSWGSPQQDQMINQAVAQLTQRGIHVIVAAGNDSGPVNWPAKLSGSNPLVYAVAASDQRDQITNFSSRGPEIKAISPGAAIVSNWPGGGTRPLDGTSMATPHVAGICAYGVARGLRPCFKAGGSVANYPFPDAAETAR